MRNQPCKSVPPLLWLAIIVCTGSLTATAQDGFAWSGKDRKSRNVTVAAENTAQEGKKETLLQVLTQLNKKKNVYFLFAEPSLGKTMVTPVEDDKKHIEKILQQLLRNTDLTYKKISDNTFVIVLKDKNKKDDNEAGTGLDLGGLLDQVEFRETVTGVVKDGQGVPLAGVSVMIKNTSRGTTTNNKGEYSLEADKGAVLVFTLVGYLPGEATVGESSSIDITLEMAPDEMNEVVVTALGIRKEARRVGYAVSTLQGDEFTQAREINVGNALVGKVAGVNSTSAVTGPGGSSRVTIRGNSSLTFDNQPLYVINGIPMNNDNLGSAGKWGGADLGDGISSINPDDIAEMTVLKGAAAAALYGQRGRNGVILITTKSGKMKNALGVELNSNVMIDQINDFTDFQQVYGQGVQGNKPTDQTSALQSGLSSWGAKLDGSGVTQIGRAHV